jgi:alpha,alpha-trehalase
MTLQIYNQLRKETPQERESANSWLKRAMQAAVKEYHTIWMVPPRLDPVTGLSRYHPDGLGIPPETEASHFTHILEPFAQKRGISILEFTEAYNDGKIQEPDLDEYFVHDRAVRESGHDTTYRFEKKCAHLATIDLNALLFKYEVDIATAIELLGGALELEEDFALSPFPPSKETFEAGKKSGFERSLSRKQTKEEWIKRSQWREERINKYLWNEGKKLYFDYDTVAESQIPYESVTAFWALWAGCASEQQAHDVMCVLYLRF